MGTPWSVQEIDYLRTNYRKRSLNDIALALGRPFWGVRAKVTILGLGKALLWWTAEQDQFLRDNRAKGWRWCAVQLRKPLNGIYARAKRLGIQHKHLKAKDRKRMLQLHAKGWQNPRIGKALGVSHECIRMNLLALGMRGNPRDERKRMKTLRQTLLNNYGVKEVAHARKLRRRRAGLAAVAAGIESLGNALTEALSKAEGKPCQKSAG